MMAKLPASEAPASKAPASKAPASKLPASKAPASKASTWTQYKVLLGKDLRMEFRTHEMTSSMVLYAFLVLTVYGAAIAQSSDALNILQMAGGLLWVVIIFTSLLGLNRSFSHEKENNCLEGLLLVPMDRAVIFLAKMTANLIFLLIVEVITVPLFYFFFLSSAQVAPTAPMAIPPLLVGTVGVAGVGTLLSTMTANTRGRDVILAVLFIPLIFPLLYSCVAATSVVLLGSEGYFTIWWHALVLGGGYDLIMILAAYALYGYAISA